MADNIMYRVLKHELHYRDPNDTYVKFLERAVRTAYGVELDDTDADTDTDTDTDVNAEEEYGRTG